MNTEDRRYAQVVGTLLVLLLLALGLAIAGNAGAQEEAPAPRMVTVAPGCEVEATEALALCVRETITNEHGQFAGATLHLQLADEGWVQFTPCDDLMVRCELAHLRMEGIAQGEVFVLDTSAP